MTATPTTTVGPRVRGAGGVEIATYHLGGDGPPVMLLHATGFPGRAFEPMAAALIPYFSVWAIDQRGHGASGKAPDRVYHDWRTFRDDLFAVLDALELDGWRGFGHSLGGAVLLMAEHDRPGTFRDLCCYEPVVLPPSLLEADRGPERRDLGLLARKRRASFPSRVDARANYVSKPPFERFTRAALDAYVEFGLVDGPEGVTLACVREDEASVYEGAPLNGVWDILGEVRAPVLFVGGDDRTDPVSAVIADLARQVPRGAARRMSGLSHFGPFEDPLSVGRVAAAAFGAGPDESPIAVPPAG
jgi:pimeloyl-ACP methyl ester carboxylesterase